MDASSSEEKQEKNGLLIKCVLRDNVKKSPNKESSNPMEEFQEKYFAPGTKGYFEKSSPLPLLSATNLLILRRLKTGTKYYTPLEEEEEDEKREELGSNGRRRNRSNSTEMSFYDSKDFYLIRACWEMILSFMGDNDDETEKVSSVEPESPSTLLRRKTLTSRKKGWRKPRGNTDAGFERDPSNKRPVSMYAAPDLNGNPRKLSNDQHVFAKTSLGNMTVLEKVRFLTNVGIETPCFRDEIFSQVLKQLIGNPSTRSCTLGWILLSLLLSCFPPSEKMCSYVTSFLQKQKTNFGSFCLEKLERTLVTGERKNPPCSLELQAAKSRQQIRIPIICMDYSVRTLWIDAASTAREVCLKMASKNSQRDSFGFALYLALDNKLVTLGNRNFHVMDAISQAERFSKLNKVQDTWRIYYRREFFSPLDASGVNCNPMNNWLTYSQICGGVQSEEYRCSTPQDLSLLIAHQYCVRHGLKDVNVKRVEMLCEQTLPATLVADGKKKKWVQMVCRTLKALSDKDPSSDSHDVMQQVICYGSKAFIESFTKRFYLSKFRSLASGNSFLSVSLKVNHLKIMVTPGSNGVAKKLVFEVEIHEIRSVDVSHDGDIFILHMVLANDKEYEFESPQGREIFEVLNRFIDETQKLTKA